MSEQLIAVLKKKVYDLAPHGEKDSETLRNGLKEELQYYVLNFIYHHPIYNKWTMYGGSALRIIHGLDRMSVDLDFEVSEEVTKESLNRLKEEIEEHFLKTYSTHSDFLTISIEAKRGLKLKFNVGEQLDLGHSSKQVHVKIDLNHFVFRGASTERQPINHSQLSFVIMTYKMSTLMASKLAAIFLRGTRGVGNALYKEKGRDIYDLLWYMNNKIVPDLDYLLAKDVNEAKDLRTLFDKLTIKMNAVSDENLKQDLLPLFLNRSYIENWLENWRESYFRLFDSYKICTVTTLESVQVHQNFNNDNFSFMFTYHTDEEDRFCRIRFELVEYWVEDCKKGFPILDIDEEIDAVIRFTSDGGTIGKKYHDQLKRCATLFYKKTEKFLNKTDRIALKTISTRLIRSTAEHLKQKEQILLNKSALLSCDLEDLLK